MSVADFGQSVEEVRRKLSEILPLVDAGQHAIDEAHTSFAGEMNQLESHVASMTDSLRSIDELADSFQDSLDDSQASLSQAVESMQDEVEHMNSALDNLESGLSDAQEQMQSIVEAARDGIEEVESQLQAELTSVQQDVEQLGDGLEQLGSAVQEQWNQIIQDVGTFSTEIKSTLDQTFESISGLVNSADELGASLTDKLQLLSESVGTAVSSFTDLLANQESSVTEFFTMFGSDTENLWNEGKDALAGAFEQLGSSIQQDVGEALSDLLENAVETCVQSLATEIVESGVMMELGVATTSALSPVLPEIVAAQKLVELIDFVL